MSGIREERRQQIIEAAIKVYGKKGYHRAKIEEIAIEAQIGKSTVYEYFNSKKELFEEMLRFIVGVYMDKAKITLNNIVDCKGKLIAFAIHQGSFIKRNMDLAENTITESASVSTEVKKEIIRWKRQVLTMVEDIFHQGINSGELRSDLDTRIVALTALGAINEYYGTQLLESKNLNEIDPTPIIDLLYRGISK